MTDDGSNAAPRVPQVTQPQVEGEHPLQLDLLQAHSQMQMSGPLPPPAILRQYNDAAPNAGDRLLVLVEKQAEHRMAIEARAQAANIELATGALQHQGKAQWLAFAIALAGLVGGAALGLAGAAAPAVASLLVAAVSLSASFIGGRAKAEPKPPPALPRPR